MEAMEAAFSGAFKTKRLVFRAIEETEAHKDWIFKNLWNDPVNFGLATPCVFTPQSRKGFNKDFESIMNNTLVAVFICLPAQKAGDQGAKQSDEADEKGEKTEDEEDTKIGMLVMNKFANLTFRRRTGIGIQIIEEHQNKGYGREAINWAVDWAFTFGDMHRVDIGTVSYNKRAAALYESIGFKPEGVKRETVFMNRQWYDLIDFGMLVHEWEKLRGLDGSEHGRTELAK
ncbi:hypothetical protein PFICI_07007 [Pestalotiopsis fici W106-1]|uniref:N-acetyltransferase domain-containing protein n=1 Tax=Pestalotiopsis fici (strain W106-1 / CGMCC3.15140) TaxID=1229662 RepID=W3X7H0_PESFW|nr:uncharacterized protein PFICI_07007 [Pestalotiopsis fici W106-1]ETS82005.1 hypothetical protein PFICI_07007 [Pestalotiopsis fici W106-1]